MTDVVKHMKWWGWGREGVGFHHEDKPEFAPFVLNAVGLDLHTAPPAVEPNFDELKVPRSKATAAFVKELAAIVGAEHVTKDDMMRVVHTYGKSLRDLVRIRGNMILRAPDVVVYPADEAEVQRIVDAAVAADAVIIPFGGGSNIAGSLEPYPKEKRVIISLDLGRLNQVLDVDADSGLARIQAGAQGPDLEAQLAERGAGFAVASDVALVSHRHPLTTGENIPLHHPWGFETVQSSPNLSRIIDDLDAPGGYAILLHHLFGVQLAPL